MNDNNEDVRLSYSAIYEEIKKEKRSACYSIDLLLAFCEAGLDDGQMFQIEHHIQRCDRCAAELEYIKWYQSGELESEREREDVKEIKRSLQLQMDRLLADQFQESGTGEAWYTKWISPLTDKKWIAAMACALLGVVGLLFYLQREPGIPGPTTGSKVVIRGGRLQLVFPISDLYEPPLYLSWEKVPEAKSYSVTITEVDSNPVWVGSCTGNTLYLPEEALRKLAREKTYYWYVEARSEERKIIKKSARGVFKIKGRS